MVTVEQFIKMAQEIRSAYKVEYRNGKSGEQSGGVWLCDCRGYILWILRKLGNPTSSAGTNWMIRNQMTSVEQVSKASQLAPGMAVFKSRTDTSKLPDKYKKGKPNYDPRFGEIDVYHVGIVTSTNPLVIRHCTTGGILTDTTLGKWNWAGWLKWVPTSTPDKPVTRKEFDELTKRVEALERR